ncbi:hypothetical protein CK503_05855 [Aliifodinibius salipaludis]|uniref:Cobalamin biosynthesis protein CbiX n=1 Tax=Fodinibius salipaludis TaxID=2032627 RepID=A0A2A2GB73_9BACT|nr:hypothetical protein [Aliifodinibius salipaludis]PAU94986.1 hypothetical protein CK503_05855 [Aliifodinibius salipaludis]
MKFIRLLYPLLILLMLPAMAWSTNQSDTGFLVVAPDRGFMGNEEIREAFGSFEEEYVSSLVFITEKDTDRFLQEGIDKLTSQNVDDIVVLPLFISNDHPMYKHAIQTLKEDFGKQNTQAPIHVAEVMSESYLTAELLADRIGQLSKKSGDESLVVVATGASDQAEKDAMREDVQNVLAMNEGRFNFQGESVIVFSNNGGRSDDARKQLEEKLTEIRQKELTPVVVPFSFTQKLDGMMAFSSRIRPVVADYESLFNGKDLTPHKNIELWLTKQANSYLPVTKENLGVIFMPHGSDYTWNRRMMSAVEDLQNEYMIEHAFSMADPHLVKKAAQRLEERGAKAITVVRVFSLESSFRGKTEYMLGLKKQRGHGGHSYGGVPPRIISGSDFYTLGGLEDSPLFAEALLDRVLELSESPQKETIVLTAHGTGSDEANNHWENNLERIASHMQKTAEEKGVSFRAIEYGTWREDWPDLREESINNIRNLIKEASENDGTAIVIPARTTHGGHASRWLSDLEYKHNGKGFAPHPLFEKWFEKQIQKSLDHFNEKNEGTNVLSSK